MNCSIFFLAILVSFQAIMAVPTSLIPRVEQQIGGDTPNKIQERCYGSFYGNWLPGFGLTASGLYTCPFTRVFYNSIMSSLGYGVCNTYVNNFSWGNCDVMGNCLTAYTSFQNLWTPVGLRLLADQYLKQVSYLSMFTTLQNIILPCLFHFTLRTKSNLEM